MKQEISTGTAVAIIAVVLVLLGGAIYWFLVRPETAPAPPPTAGAPSQMPPATPPAQPGQPGQAGQAGQMMQPTF